MRTVNISEKDFNSLVNRAAVYEMRQDEIRHNYDRMVKIKDYSEYVNQVRASINTKLVSSW